MRPTLAKNRFWRVVSKFSSSVSSNISPWTTVVQGEILLLTDEENLLTTRQNLFLASVALIQALGGGWDTNLLPTRRELERDISLFPQLPPNGAGVRPDPSLFLPNR